MQKDPKLSKQKRLLQKTKSKHDSVAEMLDHDATLKMSCVMQLIFCFYLRIACHIMYRGFKFNQILGGIYSCNGVELQW